MRPEEKVKRHSVRYLMRKAESDKQKALASLSLLLDCPAGIGDHSTGDYHKNLDEALDSLVDAEDRIEVVQKHFGNHLVDEKPVETA